MPIKTCGIKMSSHHLCDHNWQPWRRVKSPPNFVIHCNAPDVWNHRLYQHERLRFRTFVKVNHRFYNIFNITDYNYTSTSISRQYYFVTRMPGRIISVLSWTKVFSSHRVGNRTEVQYYIFNEISIIDYLLLCSKFHTKQKNIYL